mmetsp:Transcript_19785/g.45576  ORF Transcript_19785/g.45576 Transcript_19785/m.45576 type:complete len:209 (-) Transcript_19785:911-1537(-)
MLTMGMRSSEPAPTTKKTAPHCPTRSIRSASTNRPTHAIRTQPRLGDWYGALSTHAQLIVAILGDVAHPWKRLVSALLDDLEIPYLDARDGEVGDLKLHRDRRLVLLILLIAHARQTEMSAHQVLLAAVELLYAPDDGVALRRVLDRAYRRLERWRIGVRRHGHDNLDVVGRGALLKLRLGLYHVLNAAMRVRFYDSFDPDEGLHLRV